MKKELDYLCISGGSKSLIGQRRERANAENEKRKVKKTIILKGKDSEEEILNLGKMLKPDIRIGIVTFPLHFKEYKDIIKRARKQGKFPRKIKVEGILTSQTGKETIYGELGLEEEKLFEKKVDYVKNRRNKPLEFVKKVVKRIISLGS